MIQLNNVTKWHPTKTGRRYILRDVSTVLPEGANIAILGPNGAGKSTFMRMLAQSEHPNSGNIDVNGSISWPMGLKGGFIGNLSGRDNAKFVCRIYGYDEKKVKEKLDFIYDFAEIGDYFDMPIRTYSSGMKSRLAFGLSMSFDFDYYLVDEVLSVGDKQFRDKCREQLELKRKKSNFIIVSHDMNTLRKMCDVGIVLKNGTLRSYKNIEHAIRAYQTI